jgi:chemotaxis signal transduction protein
MKSQILEPQAPNRAPAEGVGQRYLLAQVGQHTLVFPASQVLQIIRIDRGKVLSLPFYPPVVAGIVHYNGSLLPLVTGHVLLGQAPSTGGELWTVMGWRQAHSLVGIVIDRTLGSRNRADLPPELWTTSPPDRWTLMTDDLLPPNLWQPQQ